MTDKDMHFTRTAAILFCLLAISLPASASSDEEARVADAADVLDQFLRIPEQSIPPSLLSRAYGVAVIPDVVKIGFGLGARHGKGILVVRQDDNSWSNPVFIRLTGGSVGWQIGAQSADVILVFKTRKGVDGIANGKLTLGADASISAGPVGRSTSAATDIAFEAEVVSYSRSRGLFAGVALEGTGVTMDRNANAAFYANPDLTPARIFESSPNIAPDIANTFVQVLTAQTRRLPKQPGMQTPTEPAAGNRGEESSSVRTFGIPDPGSSQPPADEDAYDQEY